MFKLEISEARSTRRSRLATKASKCFSRAGLVSACMSIAGFAALVLVQGCYSQLNARELRYVGAIAPRTEHFPVVSVPRVEGMDCCVKTNMPPTSILD